MPNDAQISALRSGDEVQGIYACTRKDRLRTRSGSPYLALELRDRTGTMPARAFRDADLLAGRFERGDLVRVRGRVERFRDELVVEVADIRRVEPDAAGASAGTGSREPGASADPAAGPARGPADTSTSVIPEDFLPVAYRDMEELDGFLEHLAREVYDPQYHALLASLVDDTDLRARWRRAPCSRAGHHAYLGGLIEHTVAVATLARELCELHRTLNPDLLLCAALVHDLGRCFEFTYGAEIGLTEEGRMLGHLALGQRLLDQRMDVAGIDAERRLALLHCVLTHHGPAAAPGGKFLSAEALALFRLNALDASVKGALEHGLG